ncbi:MAG: hypothetical protein K8I02_08280, partial [Candidatus Methylomirabilis sp.]|nr:hypothetical protein [Deltaproteobacteria bacterium]
MAEGKKGGRAWLVALLVISVAANAAIVAYFLKKPPPPPDREAENRALLAEIAKGVDPAPFERYFPFGVYLATEGFQRISQLTGRSEIGLYEDAVEDIALHYANLTANQNVNAMPSREFFADVLALYRAYGLKMWVNYQIPYWAEPDEVRRRIEESVGFFKDAPEILAWSFKDEPSTDQLLPMMRATKIVRELDPKMPVMFVFNWDQALWEFAPYVPAAAYDYYVITIGDQNPWQVRRNLENTIAKAGGRNVWFVCQAHSYTGGAVPPSAAELRLMTNHAVAAGAKGALYFLYQIMPYWDNPYIGRTLVSPFGEPSELWDEVGRQGLALR